MTRVIIEVVHAPVFNVLEPAEIISNQMQVLTARAAYNHNTLVVSLLRESL